jgi:hypothetical protein
MGSGIFITGNQNGVLFPYGLGETCYGKSKRISFPVWARESLLREIKTEFFSPTDSGKPVTGNQNVFLFPSDARNSVTGNESVTTKKEDIRGSVCPQIPSLYEYKGDGSKFMIKQKGFVCFNL